MSSDFWNFYWCLHFLPKLAVTLGICEFLSHFERTVCTEHELDGFSMSICYLLGRELMMPASIS